MSSKKNRSAGWAAFDLNQRQKQGLKLHFDVDPYPPVPSMTTTMAPSGDSMLRNVPPVLLPKMDFPILIDDNDSKKHLLNGDSSKILDNKVVKENNTVPALEKLNELHGWTDNSLTEDILDPVNINLNQVSTPLKGRVACNSSEENEIVDLAELKAVIQRCLDDKKPEKMDEGVVFENKLSNASTDIKLVSRPSMVTYGRSEENETVDLAELKAVIQACLDYMKHEQMDESACFENELSKLVSKPLMSLPAEPDWEEEDVYLYHRKDAIRVISYVFLDAYQFYSRMLPDSLVPPCFLTSVELPTSLSEFRILQITRMPISLEWNLVPLLSASQHSRAARSAFLRGDYFSAQQLSHKAQEEWRFAEQLNAKAAEEILTFTNRKNNIWKLDLHGLHACEAVHALQNHLQKIETQMPLNLAVPPKKVKPKVGIACPPLAKKHGCKGMEVKADVQNNTSSSQRHAILEVITGRGNHSRGKAVLPSAIRSFLLQNGYHFDGAKPGVVRVHPKFCSR